jgi:hypothetical protein
MDDPDRLHRLHGLDDPDRLRAGEVSATITHPAGPTWTPSAGTDKVAHNLRTVKFLCRLISDSCC